MNERQFIIMFKEIIPIAGSSIRKLSKKIDALKLYELFANNEKPDRVKKDYLYELKLDNITKDIIWECYQGDMWVTSEIYGKPMSDYERRFQ